jgi:hypothetical protein
MFLGEVYAKDAFFEVCFEDCQNIKELKTFV